MRCISRRAACAGAALTLVTVASCQDPASPTTDGERANARIPVSINGAVAIVGGQEFYGDEQSGELVPTSQFQARIEEEGSTASLTCDNWRCNAVFSASHKGMWHWTGQTLNWSISDLDYGGELGAGSVSKSGGAGCANWLSLGFTAFCSRKKQDNTHTVNNVEANWCRNKAHVTTDHTAGYGLVGSPSAGGWQIEIMAFGENSRSSIANATYDQCDPPEPKFTMSSSSQQSGSGAALTISAGHTIT